MTMEQTRALGMNLESSSGELDVTHVSRYPRRQDILTEPDEKAINAKSTKAERFQKRGDRVCSVFEEHLEDCQASKLKENLNAAQIESLTTFDEKFTLESYQHKCICQYEDIPDEINILLIGKTGSGKSATGNTIIGGKHDFKTGGASCSVTQQIDVRNTKEGRFNITVIDTPGFFNTDERLGNEVLISIIKRVTLKYEIHLFLLLINPGRITNEDEKIIDILEKELSDDLFSKCVVVIPNARATFGGKAMRSLRDDIAEVKEHRGKFSSLLKRVQDRIIAVENCFDDNSTKEFQRQKLLCCLAQVINDALTNGSSESSFIPNITKKAVLVRMDDILQIFPKAEDHEHRRKESNLMKRQMNNDTKSKHFQSNAGLPGVRNRGKKDKHALKKKTSPGSEESEDSSEDEYSCCKSM